MRIKSGIFLLIAPLLFQCKTSSTVTEAEVQQVTSLKAVSDFPIGSAISIRGLLRNEQLLALQKANFNSITATNDMKMANVARTKGEYNFEQADMMVQYAEENNQRLFGHALIWHSSTPRWLSEIENDPVALDAFMKEYITTYVGRYKGKVAGWDVVNEGMNTFGGGYRETFWYKTLGKDYIANAFRYAHAADPDAVLFYNDFNIERDMDKLNSVLEMISDLKAQGVPISGLGFQMHIRMDIPDSVIAEALRKGAATGLKIHLSEVDIIFNKHNDEQGGGIQLYETLTEEMKQQQAQKYYNLVSMYRAIVPEDQQFGITFWGYDDRTTWINGFFRIKDWPTIFDENFQPKPAYYGFARALMEKPDKKKWR